ncbi:pectinesterase/pectinesterase inhibitor PPE8B [Arachis hypogaea]|uniref:pectinesterase/pectinesterase inhibitor PPE8B n=1 Tax=Arachis hypogaea TaxID=3818 RepID=UPI000DECD030|nr:pectinesterase/pectinesterase inhibitor PPE8B [Arachis hypogaea]QHO57648.1 Pectinesterase/pectinesterase inhibitor PPE8B [Arachis hypogaea]
MARTPLLFTSLSLLFTQFLFTPFDAVLGSKGSLECLKVSHAEFTNSAKEVVGVLKSVTSTLHSEFVRNGGGFVDDHRLSSAVSACLELMDLSSDELSWVVSVSESPKGKHHGTGNLSSDLRTWLSAVLANTDTCMEGLEEGTTSSVNNIKNAVTASINKVNTMVQDLLTQVHPVSYNRVSKSKLEFPSWAESEDLEGKKLLTAVDAVVALDGSGDYTRVKDAVESAPEYSMKRYVIHIKKGVYCEKVEIHSKKWNLVMIGDGMENTVITGNSSRYFNNTTTYMTATFAVEGRGFIAQNISFHNTAGPRGSQAVALRSQSDLSVFYRCEISGYQDSLYAHSNRQFYRESIITGTVDFIFGRAAAVFQNCTILAKKGLPEQTNTITAQGANDSTSPSGFSIQFSNISAHSELLPFLNCTRTYLGRPWKEYSRTVFMQSYMSEMVSPQGWKEWNGTLYLDTLYYGEFMNYGPGSGLSERVKWPGYHVINDYDEASNFTVAQFILGDLWLPSTGVNYASGFTK